MLDDIPSKYLEGEWISVKDSIPSDERDFIEVRGIREEFFTGVSGKVNGGPWSFGKSVMWNGVTHWRPAISKETGS